MPQEAIVVAIIFMVIVAPVWIIFHYITKWRIAKTLSVDDEQMLSDLWHSAGKMEDRIRQLEKILDAEAPGWRSKA
ncbi:MULTISPECIES: envelope stress response membrane protein PspB [Azospirillaceae]|jgi:phage shock protein B|uniref:envelope stress response membrane protein PspB n=1 Tax=Azospirillaceae TaxID=2829815 RepID=UPI000B65D2C0|nr:MULTISPECIES: envelope stress response membrane protein PspB [Azospirillaceae]MDG5497147.1 envelope stress response membrane protein PspB [Niveispirillum sp. BGYR6]SNT06636.1 phage shock protein B [Azospirillum sp. RU38E]SNT21618.1 phage shock protein B [Azospirillum sp. RU37A]